jgi:hypothetical protein
LAAIKVFEMSRALLFLIFWLLYLGAMLFFAFSYLEKADSERAIGYALGAGIGLINGVRIVGRFRSFSLQGDELMIRQMLRKEKKYNLQLIESWEEYTYSFLGYSTGQKILLKTQDGLEIELLDEGSPTEYEKLSQYLNRNFLMLNAND